MENIHLAHRIRESRKAIGATQEDLAEMSGISLRTIQRIENGETDPRGDTMKRLALALNTSPDELLDWRKTEDRGFLTFMKLCGLTFILYPILGLLISMALWILKKDKVKHVDEEGKKMLNFLITNACIYYLTIGFVFVIIGFQVNIPKYDLPLNFVIIITLIYYSNIVLQILYNAVRVYKRRPSKYYLTIKLLK